MFLILVCNNYAYFTLGQQRKSWVLRLLSIACLSLAAKIEECIVPLLSQYQSEECKFDSSTIQRMELLVLSTLEWRMSSVTPFAYLGYFLSKLQIDKESKETQSKPIGFILAIVEGNGNFILLIDLIFSFLYFCLMYILSEFRY